MVIILPLRLIFLLPFGKKINLRGKKTERRLDLFCRSQKNVLPLQTEQKTKKKSVKTKIFKKILT